MDICMYCLEEIELFEGFWYSTSGNATSASVCFSDSAPKLEDGYGHHEKRLATIVDYSAKATKHRVKRHGFW